MRVPAKLDGKTIEQLRLCDQALDFRDRTRTRSKIDHSTCRCFRETRLATQTSHIAIASQVSNCHASTTWSPFGQQETDENLFPVLRQRMPVRSSRDRSREAMCGMPQIPLIKTLADCVHRVDFQPFAKLGSLLIRARSFILSAFAKCI